MQRKAMLAAAAALTVTAALFAAGPVSGAEPTTLDTQALTAGVPVRAAPASSGSFLVTGTGLTTQALDAATIQDLTTAATQNGQNATAVIAAHQGIHEFSAYIDQLEETRSDLFVRSGIAAAGTTADYWVQFTAMPPADIISGLQSLPVNTEVQFGAPASATELFDVAYALTTSLAANSDVISASGTRYDPVRRVMRLQYAPVGVSTSSLSSALSAALAAAAAAIGGQLPLPVVLESVANRTGTTEITVQGGRDLNLTSGAAHCTAGFTASRGGSRGLLTARHCNNALVYGGTEGAISTSPAQTANDAIDFQFHRTLTGNGHTTNKQFRATSRQEDDDRTVTAVANAPQGSAVCHWGRTSGYRCAFVADTDTCQTLSGHRFCALDVTTSDISAGGDSGGPWFLGLTARGGHTGAFSGVESYFTRIGRVKRNLDATVLQN